MKVVIKNLSHRAFTKMVMELGENKIWLSEDIMRDPTFKIHDITLASGVMLKTYPDDEIQETAEVFIEAGAHSVFIGEDDYERIEII